jgi:hypothetical protein
MKIKLCKEQGRKGKKELITGITFCPTLLLWFLPASHGLKVRMSRQQSESRITNQLKKRYFRNCF